MAADPRPLSASCPDPIERPWLRNVWDELTFLHWPYPPDVIQRLLPTGLRVDTFDGQAWVSLVPFVMRDAGPTIVPPIPYVATFAETNVRTYVVDSAGNRAVWFLSLDCARLPIVMFARWAIGFPYHWAKMSVEISGSRRTYVTTHRRWPRQPAARTATTIDVGDPIAEPTALDVFLTARWGTVTRAFGSLRFHPVDHPEWRLHAAEVVTLDDTAVTAPGLPAPPGPPVARWAQPIDAVFGRPVRV